MCQHKDDQNASAENSAKGELSNQNAEPIEFALSFANDSKFGHPIPERHAKDGEYMLKTKLKEKTCRQFQEASNTTKLSKVDHHDSTL